MQFYLHTGNQLEKLADRFRDQIYLTPLADPFTPEVVVVQTQGMAAWLKFRLGREGAIAANLDTPFPVNFINRTLEDVFAGRYRADADRYAAERLPWRIDRILTADDRTYPLLRRYLQPPNLELKRWQLSCRIAELFDEYRIYRPEMLAKWRRGFLDPADDDGEWQMRLYLAACADQPGREQFLNEFFALRQAPPDVLPERVTVFGVGSMPPLFLDFFLKLAAFTPVHFFYLNPCREYWSDQYSDREAARLLRRDGGELEAFHDGNPLLASLGAHGREFFRYLAGIPEVICPGGDSPEEENSFASFCATDGPGPDDYRDPTRLTALQQDIFAMFRRGPAADGEITGTPLAFPPDDRSVRIHNCHSARREIEVLHDQLLELLEDPEIQPRDVIVMAPDINLYVPYIHSVFGQGPLRRVYSVSDRSLRHASRIAEAFFGLLGLRDGRLEVSAVFELLHTPAIYRRFGLAGEDLPAIAAWIEAARIRWGIDADDRAACCNAAFEEYSWRQGLDRLLLGFARNPVAEDADCDGLLPLPAVEGDGAVILGRFVRFMERLFEWKSDMTQTLPPQKWSERLLRLADEFFAVEDEATEELSALRRAILTTGKLAAAAEFNAAVPVEVMEEAIAARLPETGRNDPFLRGRITLCSLVPMRSIPQKVVAVLGLNDGAFPRQDIRLGFNLVHRKTARGDRSRQAEDRYLFLEALLSARRTLLLFYQGQDSRGKGEFPPAIPLGEVIDYLQASSATPFEVTRHRLQPFEPDYFNPDNPNPELRSKSEENYLAARALLAPKKAHPISSEEFTGDAALPPPGPTVTLEELDACFRNPCRWFLNRCAGVNLREEADATPDSEPTAVNFNKLEEYVLKTEIGALSFRDLPRDTQLRLLRRASRLPVGPEGERLFNKLYDTLRALPRAWLARLGGQIALPFAIDVREENRGEEFADLELFAATAPATQITAPYRVSGTLQAAPDLSSQYILHYSKLKAPVAVRARLRHLLLTLLYGDNAETRLMTLEKEGPAEWFLPPVTREEARRLLIDFLALYRQSCGEPLPFFPEASWAYFHAPQQKAWLEAAKSFYRNGRQQRGHRDQDDPVIRFCFEIADFEEPAFSTAFTRAAAILLGMPPLRRVET